MWSIRTVDKALSGHAPSYLADDYCLITNARPRKLRPIIVRFSSGRTQTNLGDRAGLLWACWIRSPELFANRPRTAGLGMQPFQTVAGDILFGLWDKTQCESSFNCTLEIVYTFTYLPVTRPAVYRLEKELQGRDCATGGLCLQKHR